MSTEPISAPRGLWQLILSISTHTDMSGADRIAALTVTERDYETNNFLALRYKLFEGIVRGLEDEQVRRVGGEEPTTSGVKEAIVEIQLNVAELTYLDMIVEMTAFQGALVFKQKIWKALMKLIKHEKNIR